MKYIKQFLLLIIFILSVVSNSNAKGIKFGKVSKDKADDMLQQQKDAHKQHKRTAIVVDSTADLPDSILEEKNIHVVPVRLNFGDKHYIDKVKLSNEEFWDE